MEKHTELRGLWGLNDKEKVREQKITEGIKESQKKEAPVKISNIEDSEKDIEKIQKTIEDTLKTEEVKTASTQSTQKKKSKTSQQAQLKSDDLIAIEKILAEDLEDVYKALPDNLKNDFKITGEETARKIEELVAKVKVNTKKIVKLIVNWLKIIPGVNKFFLEQEAKIKTDAIINELKKDS